MYYENSRMHKKHNTWIALPAPLETIKQVLVRLCLSMYIFEGYLIVGPSRNSFFF